MSKGLQLTESDINKYRKEIDEIRLNEKADVLLRSSIKINELLKNPKLDQFQLLLVQELNVLHSILRNTHNLETSIQQKIIFALKYFLKSKDDIPDEIPGIGFIDDLAVVDWTIQEIKEQYSHYFQA